MKKNLSESKETPAEELVVIPDECGDSLWDAVLQQEEKKQDAKTSEHAALLLNNIDAAKASTTLQP
ncbi:hypothetical protein [Foetidibacter luteolus]|uniref:hypothetical protein n=1 Tax=Foetidibacter luteolus TaxID=2608880 RepID=UPI00129B6C64|nr:hypothetical protein [Foetidibacter luteolus]